jgi:hypothetical protein
MIRLISHESDYDVAFEEIERYFESAGRLAPLGRLSAYRNHAFAGSRMPAATASLLCMGLFSIF